MGHEQKVTNFRAAETLKSELTLITRFLVIKLHAFITLSIDPGPILYL